MKSGTFTISRRTSLRRNHRCNFCHPLCTHNRSTSKFQEGKEVALCNGVSQEKKEIKARFELHFGKVKKGLKTEPHFFLAAHCYPPFLPRVAEHRVFLRHHRVELVADHVERAASSRPFRTRHDHPHPEDQPSAITTNLTASSPPPPPPHSTTTGSHSNATTRLKTEPHFFLAAHCYPPFLPRVAEHRVFLRHHRVELVADHVERAASSRPFRTRHDHPHPEDQPSAITTNLTASSPPPPPPHSTTTGSHSNATTPKCCNEGDGIWCVLVFLLVSRLRNVEVQVQQWDSCSLLQKMESVAAMDAICVDECSADAVLVHVREAAMVGARLLSPPPPPPHSTTTGSHSNATTRIPHLHFSVVLSHPPFGPFTLSQSGALPNIPFLCLFPRRQQRLRL
ncbi:hypothetical protein DEO72_LG2g2947 [Vigna unguiculata]|uniref:Uncharacterized protein n=1 Tax=Vigna unguiculata TaxID=3917 RepID=A0A4D6L248_VIGUN|nr:hypothetical protein DEO72_LG2g2947 [Vigna unguiculata]